MSGKVLIGIVLVLVVAGAVTGGILYTRHRTAGQQCALCARPVHDNARTVTEVDGKREDTCCPACALAQRAQTGHKVKLISVADYDTHQQIDPHKATYIVGSDVSICTQHANGHQAADDKYPLARRYDRCEPSILAFTSRERAEQFAKEHGGNLAGLRELGIKE